MAVAVVMAIKKVVTDLGQTPTPKPQVKTPPRNKPHPDLNDDLPF